VLTVGWGSASLASAAVEMWWVGGGGPPVRAASWVQVTPNAVQAQEVGCVAGDGLFGMVVLTGGDVAGASPTVVVLRAGDAGPVLAAATPGSMLVCDVRALGGEPATALVAAAGGVTPGGPGTGGELLAWVVGGAA
jgi:hypothetical protein